MACGETMPVSLLPVRSLIFESWGSWQPPHSAVLTKKVLKLSSVGTARAKVPAVRRYVVRQGSPMLTLTHSTTEDVPLRVRVAMCSVCHGGKIICAFHPDKPLAHDGCEDPGMPCPRCTMTVHNGPRARVGDIASAD